MTYVPNICPECGASLDPGERCDCKVVSDAESGQESEGEADISAK